ncbi:Polysaccharide biosynthesis protein [Teratosphaeria destructans]|uniref:Polysaccharide biosynthesis protein n=1 Tax=Teratosphaeria destructans TaxID=418781 RepID=A0A9W7SZW5_9PEZI|nr:Polysaccharide biosynthesis protein [Teratosphaeria destructans]
MASGSKRIVFTGGSGKAGRHAIPYLLNKGHSVLNLDLVEFPQGHIPQGKQVFTLKTDLTQSGQVFNALTTHFNFDGYEDGQPQAPPDVVIHFAAYARNLLVPDNECFKANVTSTYNVIEAASKLGVKKIIIASSETTYGVCFSEGKTNYQQFPLEEDTYDRDPMDSYALSKLCGERTARTFSRRYGHDIYALIIGNVIEPHEYERDFPTHVNKPETRRRNAWSYIDARDLGQICDLCIQKNGLGFQVVSIPAAVLSHSVSMLMLLQFNATNDTITTKESTKEFLAKWEPNTKITRELGEFEAPLSNRKIREVLGFKEEHNWRNYYRP